MLDKENIIAFLNDQLLFYEKLKEEEKKVRKGNPFVFCLAGSISTIKNILELIEEGKFNA